MYTDDLISREELNTKIGGMRKEIERLENELKMVSYHLTKGEQLEHILGNTFKAVEDITDVHQMTNEQLKQIIQKIEVDKEGNVDIFLRLFGDLGLEEAVLIENTANETENMPNTAKNMQNTTDINNILNSNNYTEGHFGDIKENDDFRRFNHRSTEKVYKEFMLYAIGRNINKYHRFLNSKLQKFKGKKEENIAS